MDEATRIGAASALGNGLFLFGAAGARGWDTAYRPEQPSRLSDETHAHALRSLSGEHGRSMVAADFALDEAATAGLSPEMRYAHAARLIAERAPIRILPGERIVGSATLLEAAWHQMPVAGCPSTSHTTAGFHRVVPLGYRTLRAQCEERLARGDLDDKGRDLVEAMQVCLEAAATWTARHLEELERLAGVSTGSEREGHVRLAGILRRVPEGPPTTFHEAVQSLWMLWAFQRLCGNWLGLGRIDQYLGPFLAEDLSEGRTTLDEAREVLAHFWIKGTEWTGVPDAGGGSGDGQYYQNVVLGGVNAQGSDVTNEVTYLVLDIIEELHICDFPVAVRIGRNSPERLLRRIAEVQRQGGGIVAVYNEEVVIEGLTRFGYALEEARGFANDGCWEVLVPGRTYFTYAPFDALRILQDVLGVTGEGPVAAYDDFESLYAAFRDRLAAHVEAFHEQADRFATGGPPAPLLSLLVEDCIERGRGYYERGARYSVQAPHAGGLANVANSLLVLRTLVFEDGLMSLPDLVGILRQDWEGHEELRRMVQSRFDFYGNDAAEADALMRRVFDDYTELVGEVKERAGVLRPAGISTFGREIAWRYERGATADGHRVGEILATNFSPSPGTDRTGPTAAVQSYCGMDFTRTPNGATLELKLHPGSTAGEEGLQALVGLLRAFVDLGGFYMQVDVVDTALLLDAQQHPECYPNLSVRISGWSARFATLSREWQAMIIGRTQQEW
jgi:pyruvate-formate lyase